MNIILRPPTEADFAMLATIRCDRATQDLLMGYPPAGTPTDTDVGAWIKRKTDDALELFLVIAADSEGVGFIQTSETHKRGERCHVGLAIAPSRRGAAYGTHSLNALLELVPARGIRKVFAEILASNSASRALFSKAGFREVGVMLDHYEGQDVVLVETILTAAPRHRM